MNGPLVSVIVPMYNHARYVRQCLTSVAQQTYRSIEIIAIDDGSTDETAQIARDTLAEFDLPAAVISRTNCGAALTINEGMARANGDYLTILNSDDYFHPARISSCLDLATRRAAPFVFTDVEFVDEDGEIAPSDPYIHGLRRVEAEAARYPSLGFALARNQLAITTGNFFLSRDLYQKVGPFRDYRYVHDWDFILRSLYYSEPIKLDYRLYYYRFHGENSFKTLADVAGYETTEVMANFLWLMTSRVPENVRAPSPAFWPGLFEHTMRAWSYQGYLPPHLRDGR